MTSERTSHFLLVEDDLDAVALLRRALARTRVDAACHVAYDGDEALAYLQGRASDSLPCLVVLDVHMPRRSGLQVLEWLRGQSGLRHIPAVMLTTSADPQDVKRAAELGARAYWLKPLGAEGLKRIARRIGTFVKLFSKHLEASAD
jgi:CheY-like chemotaxis protein